MAKKYEVHILSGRVREVPANHVNRNLVYLVMTESEFQERQDDFWFPTISPKDIVPLSKYPHWQQLKRR